MRGRRKRKHPKAFYLPIPGEGLLSAGLTECLARQLPQLDEIPRSQGFCDIDYLPLSEHPWTSSVARIIAARRRNQSA